jgi:hypothetical protein
VPLRSERTEDCMAISLYLRKRVQVIDDRTVSYTICYFRAEVLVKRYLPGLQLPLLSVWPSRFLVARAHIQFVLNGLRFA